jgi:uncharacterized protein YkwD
MRISLDKEDQMSDATDTAAQPVPGYAPLPGVSSEIGELFNRVNNYRRSLGLPGLSMSAKLNQAAQVQVDYLAANNLLTHDGSDANGVTYIADRQYDVGYYGQVANENAMQGAPTAAAALAGWQKSTGHNNTLTDNNGEYLFTGLATATSANGTRYWVETFNGQPEDGMTQAQMAQLCVFNNPERPQYQQYRKNSLASCKRERATSQPPAQDGLAICDAVSFIDNGERLEGVIIDYDPAENKDYPYLVAARHPDGELQLTLAKDELTRL